MTLRDEFETKLAGGDPVTVQYRAALDKPDIGAEDLRGDVEASVEQVFEEDGSALMPYRKNHVDYQERFRFKSEAQDDFLRKLQHGKL